MKKYSTMSLVPMLTISGDFSAGVQRPTPPQNTHRIKFPVQGVRERYRQKKGNIVHGWKMSDCDIIERWISLVGIFHDVHLSFSVFSHPHWDINCMFGGCKRHLSEFHILARHVKLLYVFLLGAKCIKTCMRTNDFLLHKHTHLVSSTNTTPPFGKLNWTLNFKLQIYCGIYKIFPEKLPVQRILIRTSELYGIFVVEFVERS